MTAPRQGALATPRIQQLVETPAGETLPIPDAILQIIRAGGSRKAAATWAGIHPATLADWVNRGLATWEKIHDNPEEPPVNLEKPGNPETTPDDPLASLPPSERHYVDLAIAVTQAEVAAEMRLVTSLYEAAKVDWRATIEILRARERGGTGGCTWNQKTAVELSGPGGGPVVPAGVTVLSDTAFAQKVAELERRRSAALDVAEAAHG